MAKTHQDPFTKFPNTRIPTLAQSLPILKAARDRDINTIDSDTANNYSNEESEKVVGAFIKQHDIPLERLVILTKCFGLVGNAPNIMSSLHPNLKTERDYINQYGLSRAAIYNAVDASLQRLETPYIDLLQITPLRRQHANRTDDEGATRPGATGQGAVHRRRLDVRMAVRVYEPRGREEWLDEIVGEMA